MPVITENTNFISHRSAGVFEFIVSVHCQHFSSQCFSFAEAFASLAVGVFVFVAEQRTHGSRVCALNIIILVSCSTIFFSVFIWIYLWVIHSMSAAGRLHLFLACEKNIIGASMLIEASPCRPDGFWQCDENLRAACLPPSVWLIAFFRWLRWRSSSTCIFLPPTEKPQNLAHHCYFDYFTAITYSFVT